MSDTWDNEGGQRDDEYADLLARLDEYVKQWEDFDHGTWPECRAMREAAAAIRELQTENARLTNAQSESCTDAKEQAMGCFRAVQAERLAEKAEAERDALRQDAESWRDSFALLHEDQFDIRIRTIANGKMLQIMKIVPAREVVEPAFEFTLRKLDAAIRAPLK